MSNRIMMLALATLGIGAAGTASRAALLVPNRPTVRALDEDAKDKSKEKEEKEDKVAVDKLPAAVVDAVKKEVTGGTITDAEKQEKDGKIVYEMDVKAGDITYEVKISEDGKFISKKVDDEKGEKK